MGDNTLSVGSLSVYSLVFARGLAILEDCRSDTGKELQRSFLLSSRKGQCIPIGHPRALESIAGCKGMGGLEQELLLCSGGRNSMGELTGDTLLSDFFEPCI